MPMKTKKKTARTHASELLNDFFSVKDEKEYDKTEKSMLLAVRIEEAMKKRGFNKLQFAEAIKVQPSVITRWLSGSHNFTIETLYDIERILSINIVNVIEPRLIEIIDHLHVTVVTSNKIPAGSPAGILDYDPTQLRLLNTANPKILQN
jgi:transcriptional regulator with XRE-family HTH domain